MCDTDPESDGDITLASEQLNHASTAVTAAFYTELKKKRKKKIVQGLDEDNDLKANLAMSQRLYSK